MTETLPIARVPKPADFVPVELFPEGHKWAGQRRCTAWSPNNGRQCESRPILGTSKCRAHGGRSLKGAAAGNHITGRYSKFLPVRLVDRYKAGLKNPDLIALRDEIALMDARVQELLQKVGEGESADVWKRLREKRALVIAANQHGEQQAVAALLNDILGLIEQGSGDYAVWMEIRDSLDVRRKLVEAETRRLVQAQLMLSTDEAMALVAQMAGIIQKHVQDPNTLSRLTGELAGLVNRSAD